MAMVTACTPKPPAPPPEWEITNPLKPLAPSPLGSEIDLTTLKEPPTPERVRLGRWLFYDTRLSGDASVACATCHRPEHAFSEPTAVSAGTTGKNPSSRAKANTVR